MIWRTEYHSVKAYDYPTQPYSAMPIGPVSGSTTLGEALQAAVSFAKTNWPSKFNRDGILSIHLTQRWPLVERVGEEFWYCDILDSSSRAMEFTLRLTP